MIPSMVYWDWWLRWVETRVVTDEATYTDGQVPDDYGGPQLTVGVVQQVIVCTKSGHFQKYKFGSMLNVKDKDRKTGLGIKIEKYNGTNTEQEGAIIPEETIAATGPSEVIAQWKLEENQLLPAEFRAAMVISYKASLANLET